MTADDGGVWSDISLSGSDRPNDQPASQPARKYEEEIRELMTNTINLDLNHFP